MTAKTLRKEAHELLDQVDDQFLKIVHQLLLSRQISSSPIEFTPSEKAMLLKRRDEMLTGQVEGVLLEDSIKAAKARLEKKKK